MTWVFFRVDALGEIRPPLSASCITVFVNQRRNRPYIEEVTECRESVENTLCYELDSWELKISDCKGLDPMKAEVTAELYRSAETN